MDFEKKLSLLAEKYTDKGYHVVVRPQPDDLPSFAKDFKVEIVGRRAASGVLVSVKKNRQEMESDKEMVRYAEVTSAEPGWRYDFAILEAESQSKGNGIAAEEQTDDDLVKFLDNAELLAGTQYVNAACLVAWAGLEAAMRRRLRAAAERADSGTATRTLLNELYSIGVLTMEELPQLEKLFQLRNRIAHGFAAQVTDKASAHLMIDLARRLLSESQRLKQPA